MEIRSINFDISTPKKRYEHVVESLEKAIVHSREAEKLPSEQELAESFNVSKAVIREALTVLKERGLVHSRNGDGSYVSKPNTETVASAVGRIVATSNISDQDLHETRLILEVATIRRAAENITPEEILHLESLIQAMSDLSQPYEEWMAIDRQFHVAIAKAARNGSLSMLVEVMMLLLKKYMFKALCGKYDQSTTLVDHRNVVEALKTASPDQCEQAMRTHLLCAWNNVVSYTAHGPKL